MIANSQGRLPDRRPLSIIDIGSNSIRLVVYEGVARSPTVLFNEKMLAGLGRGIVTTGPMRVEWTDPLGLAKRTTRLPGRGEVLVVPERVPMMFPGLGSNGPLGTHLRMKAMGRSGKGLLQ